MIEKEQYDYIILGSGLSGMMLAFRMAKDPFFQHKKILLLDKELKKSNDRTWCFWHSGTSDWEKVISKKWNTIAFKSPPFSEEIKLSPYSYNKIESRDFYTYCLAVIDQAANITVKTESVLKLQEQRDFVTVITDQSRYVGQKIFSSILPKERLENQTQYPVLQQHFIGWFIKTKAPFFNPEVATFMDFTIPQRGNTRFMYVLPTTTTEALVEYTLFSEDLLQDVAYEAAIKDYLQQHNLPEYELVAKEKGCIPMTAFPLERYNTSNLMHIGTAGGWTRGSTGYTFNYTDTYSDKLIAFLKTESDFTKFIIKDRFRWYDRIFLEVLYRRNELGASLFATMFQKNEIGKIFRFLDGESTLREDLSLIWSLPKKEFITAFLNQFKRNERF